MKIVELAQRAFGSSKCTKIFLTAEEKLDRVLVEHRQQKGISANGDADNPMRTKRHRNPRSMKAVEPRLEKCNVHGLVVKYGQMAKKMAKIRIWSMV